MSAVSAAASVPPSAADDPRWRVHRAVLENDQRAFDAALARVQAMRGSGDASARADAEHLIADRDPRGNSPLHLAVVLRRMHMVSSLLEAGAPTLLRDALGFTARDYVVLMGSEMLLKQMLAVQARRSMANLASVAASVRDVLRQRMTDLELDVRWALESSIPFVTRFLPHDVVKIAKRGADIRADMTLIDVSRTLRVTRGDVSALMLLNDANATTSLGELLLMDHVQCEVSSVRLADLAPGSDRTAERVARDAKAIDELAAQLLDTEPIAGRVDVTRAHLNWHTGWFGRTETDTIAGMRARCAAIEGIVFERGALDLRGAQWWADYGAGRVQVTCASAAAYFAQGASLPPALPIAEAPALRRTRRVVTVRAWYADDMPLAAQPFWELLGTLLNTPVFHELQGKLASLLPPTLPLRIEVPIIGPVLRAVIETVRVRTACAQAIAVVPERLAVVEWDAMQINRTLMRRVRRSRQRGAAAAAASSTGAAGAHADADTDSDGDGDGDGDAERESRAKHVLSVLRAAAQRYRASGDDTHDDAAAKP